jgi:hypothetical protein
VQGFLQRLTPSLHRHRSPREILHKTVDDKTLRHAVLADRARDERIGVEAGARSLCVVVGPLARHGGVDERIGNRIGFAKNARRSRKRRLSGERRATEVAHVAARPTSWL